MLKCLGFPEILVTLTGGPIGNRGLSGFPVGSFQFVQSILALTVFQGNASFLVCTVPFRGRIFARLHLYFGFASDFKIGCGLAALGDEGF